MLKRLLILGLFGAMLFFVSACGEVQVKIHEVQNGTLKSGGIYYVEASGGVNVPGMGAIFYKNEKRDKNGNEIALLVNGISPNIWQRVLPVLIGAGGYIAGNAVYGLSMEAAKTIVDTTVNANAQGGAGGVASGGNATTGPVNAVGGSATGGSAVTGPVTSTSSGGTVTGTVTGGDVTTGPVTVTGGDTTVTSTATTGDVTATGGESASTATGGNATSTSTATGGEAISVDGDLNQCTGNASC